MNTYKYIFIVSLLSLSLYSCTKLEEYNPSGELADDVWTSPDGFQTLINAAYNPQRTFYGKEDGVIMGEAGTDIWFRASMSTSYRQLFRYMDFTSSGAGTNNTYWRDIWPGVNFCNAGIERINQAGFTSESLKKQKEGELRFLRAYYYWHIVETWGGVYLRTKETTSPDFIATRNTVEECYDLIISDLDSAAVWLPSKATKEYGRAIKKSAYGFLARALLSRAYYSLDKNNKAEADAYFTRAKNVAHLVIDSAAKWGVSLYPNYADLWKNTVDASGNNKNSKEALYVVTNSKNFALDYDQNGNRLHMWFMAKYDDKPGMQMDLANGMTSARYFMPTKFLLYLFDETKDSRYSASFQDTWISNKTTPFTWTTAIAKTYKKDASVVGKVINPGDTAIYISKYVVPDKRIRKYWLIDRDSLFRADTVYNVCDMYPVLKKYMDPNRTAANAQPGYLDIIVMRLAEMYLIAAEAEFQLGDNTSAATDINVIRKRASKTHSNDMNILPSDVTLDFILDERAREFAGEHMRWFDLKRTRTLVQRIQKYNKNIHFTNNLLQKGNGVFENVLLRPIPPQNEIDLLTNSADFPQNPGY